MKKLGIIVLSILLLAMLVVSFDSLRTRSTAKRARAIRIGDSKKRVTEILGHPVTAFLPQPRTNIALLFLGPSSETWAYGSRLELRQPFQKEFPYFMPIRVRFFIPDKDDVAVKFDSSNRVSKITIP